MPRRRTALWSLVGVLTAAAAMTAMWRASDLGRASADLEHQRTAAKRESVPIDTADMLRIAPPVDDADNAASLYRQGFAEIHAEDGSRGLSSRLLIAMIEGKARPEDLARVRTALTKDARGLAYVVEGTARKTCRFSREWEQGPHLLLPEFSDMRGAALALVFRALLANAPEAAGKDLRAAARLVAHAGSEPLLISPLMGASTEELVERGLRAAGRRGPAWVQAVRPALEEFGPLPDAHRYLAFESFMGRNVVKDLGHLDMAELIRLSYSDGDGAGSRSAPLAVRFTKLKPVRDAFEARTIQYWRSVYAALPSDPLDWRTMNAAAKTPYPAAPSGALVALMSPGLNGIGALAAKMEAGRRLTQAVLDLEENRRSPLPGDPFGSGPLKIRREGQSWILWSVGPDGVDQGGRERDDKTRFRNDDSAYDLVVKVPPLREGARVEGAPHGR